MTEQYNNLYGGEAQPLPVNAPAIPKEETICDRKEQIGKRTCHCHQHGIAAGLFEMTASDLHGFCPAETNQQHASHTHPIDMGKGIQRQATHHAGRGITQCIRHAGMGILMHGKGDDHRRQRADDIDDLIHEIHLD